MNAWGLSDLVTAMAIHPIWPVVAASSVILALSFATVHYLEYWQNGVQLFTHASVMAGQPDPAIEEALADALVSAHRYDEAYRHYGEACTLRPQDTLCHYNMAEILFHRHQLEDALGQYDIAASLPDGQAMALSCLINTAEILLDMGDYEGAERRIGAALNIDPNDTSALQLRQRIVDQKSRTSY